jgi:hypothetical protein
MQSDLTNGTSNNKCDNIIKYLIKHKISKVDKTDEDLFVASG